jgi:phosphotriesterase-related protein
MVLELAGVETVRGWIAESELGITFLHEHILDDASAWFNQPEQNFKRHVVDAPVSMRNRGLIHMDANISKDNLTLNEPDVAADELRELKELGGATIVDLTPDGIGRNPVGLRTVSEKTGINIVASTGWYVVASHPAYVKQKSIDELCETMVADITNGIGNTGIKAGSIKVGCSNPIPYHPEELKVLRAAGRAMRKTGSILTVHPPIVDLVTRTFASDRMLFAEEYCRILDEEDANLDKFVFGHAHYLNMKLDHYRRVLDKMPITLSFDCFGEEQYYETWWYGARSCTDAERVQMVTALCKEGYDKQLILSHDVDTKMKLKKYGGMGYTYILQHIVPWLKYNGVTDNQIRNMLVDNPRRLLSH